MQTIFKTTPTHDLFKKYNVAAPRYTSYPTVPYWDNTTFSSKRWEDHFSLSFEQNPEISLYIHLPYCESLCTYCGCNTRITKQHSVEQPYIEALLNEWDLYLERFSSKPILKEIHLGGGTPTFFSPKHLNNLLEGIFRKSSVASNYSFGFEAHPNSTTNAHLETLFQLGFRRLSIGIQDFSPEILQLINRNQTQDQVYRVTEKAREIGYSSLNYDIIFGLPRQQQSHIEATIAKVNQLRPERIAFYSYAHVPWIKPGQRAYSEVDLPTDAEKRKLYEYGRGLLELGGYREIGMDHFALPQDDLYVAMQKGTLHRNFMGYTPFHTRLMVGLGVSSISDSWTAFAQNEKKVEDYFRRVGECELPVFRGHVLNEEDQLLRQHILNVMCRLETSWENPAQQHPSLEDGIGRLDEMEEDGLLAREAFGLKVTESGRAFIRNCCMALDARLWRNKPQSQLFSQVV